MNAKHYTLRSLVLVGLCFLAVSLSLQASAQSAMQVQITSGDAAPVVIKSNNFVESSPVTINGWTINGLGGGANSDLIDVGSGGTPSCESYPATCMGLICAAHPCTVDPLKIEVSETGFEVSATGFTSPAVGFYVQECCGDIPAGITMSMAGYLSASDLLDMTTTSIATLTLTGPLGYQSSGTPIRGQVAGPSPYSLTLIDTFTADSTGLYLPEENTYLAAQPVSEPASLLLLGSGLLLLGIARRKRPHCRRRLLERTPA